MLVGWQYVPLAAVWTVRDVRERMEVEDLKEEQKMKILQLQAGSAPALYLAPALLLVLELVRKSGYLTAESVILKAEDFVMLPAGHLGSLVGVAPFQA